MSDQKIRFHHFREGVGWPASALTMAVIDVSDNQSAVGLAFCSQLDQFSRRLGRRIATSRAQYCVALGIGPHSIVMDSEKLKTAIITLRRATRTGITDPLSPEHIENMLGLRWPMHAKDSAEMAEWENEKGWDRQDSIDRAWQRSDDLYQDNDGGDSCDVAL